MKQANDVDFITDDVDDLLDSSTEGLTRVKEIVANLRNFSRLDEADVKVASIKDCIESTIQIASATVSQTLQIDCMLDDLPPCKCHPPS